MADAATHEERFWTGPWAVAAGCAVVTLLLTRLTGGDYLYYYLPAGEYFHRFGGPPARLLPTRIDGPFAFPPAEFYVLALSFRFGACQVYALKLFYAAKAGLGLYLAWQLGRERPGAGAWLLLLLLPAVQSLLFVAGTDLNIVLATAAVLLLARDRRWLRLAVACCGYALLSKYTFLPLYAFILVWFAVHRRDRVGPLLWPLLPFALLLARNQRLYGNPLFPVLDPLFHRLSPDVARMQARWTHITLDWPGLRNTAAFMCGGLVPLLPWLRDRGDALLSALVAGFVVLWLAGMNVDGAGDATRFLVPATLLALMALSRQPLPSRRQVVGLAGCVALPLLLSPEHSQRPAAVLCLLYLAGLRSWRPATARWLPVVLFALLCLARIGTRFSVDPHELGYAAYRTAITAVEQALDEGGPVLTDFKQLPLATRLRPNLIAEESALNGNDFGQLLRSGPPPGGLVAVLEDEPTGKPYGRGWRWQRLGQAGRMTRWRVGTP